MARATLKLDLDVIMVIEIRRMYARSNVEMDLIMGLLSVMMGILLMEMGVRIFVELKEDGHVEADQLLAPMSAIRSVGMD